VFYVRQHDVNLSLGTGFNTPLDLLTIPVDGSINLGDDKTLTMQMAFEGSYVWVAQYRLLEAKYLKLEPGEDAVILPTSFLLYPKITSKGICQTEWDQWWLVR
jgi:hypothetical protein